MAPARTLTAYAYIHKLRDYIPALLRPASPDRDSGAGQ